MTDATGLYVPSWTERVHQGETVNVAAAHDIHTDHGWVLEGETATAFAAFSLGEQDWVRLTLPGGAEVSTTTSVWIEDKTEG